MQSRIGWAWTWALAGIMLTAPLAWAQRGDREGRWDRGDREERGDRESRWGGDREGRGERSGRGRFDPADFLRRLDTNGNGQIDPDEGAGRWRGFVDQAASRAGLDPKQPLPLDKLTEAMQSRMAERESERSRDEQEQEQSKDDGDSSSKSSSGSSSTTAPAAPLVPGFGVATDLSLPPGFDVPLERTGGRYSRPLEERFERRVLERVDQMLREYDKNKNTVLEYKTSETEGVTWQFPPEQSDRNSDGRLDREELCYRIAKVLGSRERDSNDRGSRSRDSNSNSSSGESSESQQAKVRRYAEGLLKQYDKNGSGVLEREEWSTMRGDYERADTNGDKILTLDELTARLTSYGSREESSGNRGSSTASSASGGESRRGGYRSRGERGSDQGNGNGERKSYRFLTPLERLPKGLPSWFARNDADGDAQVTMAEYSSSYNETTVTEFNKYDLNGDGVITAHECLQVESSKTARK